MFSKTFHFQIAVRTNDVFDTQGVKWSSDYAMLASVLLGSRDSDPHL